MFVSFGIYHINLDNVDYILDSPITMFRNPVNGLLQKYLFDAEISALWEYGNLEEFYARGWKDEEVRGVLVYIRGSVAFDFIGTEADEFMELAREKWSKLNE